MARGVFDRTRAFPTFHGPPQIEGYLPVCALITDVNAGVVKDDQFNPKPYFDDPDIQIDFVKLNCSNPVTDTVVAYVCRLRPQKGNVILSKFDTSDVPLEHRDAISAGNDVTLDDGTVHCAKDFMSPDFDGGNFLSK